MGVNQILLVITKGLNKIFCQNSQMINNKQNMIIEGQEQKQALRNDPGIKNRHENTSLPSRSPQVRFRNVYTPHKANKIPTSPFYSKILTPFTIGDKNVNPLPTKPPQLSTKSIMRRTFANYAHSSNQTTKESSTVEKSQTGQGFRPNTGLRRYGDENHGNYLSKYEILKQLGKGTFGVVLLAKQQIKSEEEQMEKSQLYNKINKQCQKVDQARQNPEEGSKQFYQTEQPDKKKQKNIQNTRQQNLYAIKVYEKFKMNKDPSKFKNIRKEINIMQNLSHPNIIKLFESADTLTKISLVFQYGGEFSLLEYIRKHFPLQASNIKSIGKQILSALVYLHKKNIVHRDLKLQNILIDEEVVKLIDFGFTTLTFPGRKLNAICGTPNYMAPELLSKKEYIGEQADIWSFGVIMFTLGEGRHPFKADTYKELQRLANKGKFEFKRIKDLEYQNFIKRILKLNGNERPSAQQLLNHSWISN